MRPTVRGAVALVVLAVAATVVATYGARDIPTLVAPVLAALAIGTVSVATQRLPVVHRRPVEAGVVGDTRTARVTLERSDPDLTFEETTGPGLSVLDTEWDGRTHVTELRLEERGIHTVGPAQVTVRDLFGLVRRRVSHGEATQVVVGPRPRHPTPAVADALERLEAPREEGGTIEFERIREYQPGDPLRDVAWRAVGKRPDRLLVTERGGPTRGEEVTVSVSCDEETLEQTLEVAAGVAEAAADLPAIAAVELSTTAGNTQADGPASQRLRILAETGSGSVDDVGDIHVEGKERTVTVTVEGRQIPVIEEATNG